MVLSTITGKALLGATIPTRRKPMAMKKKKKKGGKRGGKRK